MGNLSDLLKNPSTPDQTLQALVTAVLEDEASGYGGISGSLTSGKMPIATGAEALADGPISDGVQSSLQTLALSEAVIEITGTVPSVASNGYSIALLDPNGGGVLVQSNGSIELEAANNIFLQSIGLTLSTTSAIDMESNGGITIADTSTTGISIIESGSGPVTIGPLIAPAVLYSAAGTPLPDPTTVAPGTEATVSDALLPTYMGAYQSGGAVVCKVISDGATGWFTH
jgi:hypothetical protein